MTYQFISTNDFTQLSKMLDESRAPICTCCNGRGQTETVCGKGFNSWTKSQRCKRCGGSGREPKVPPMWVPDDDDYS